MNYMVLLAAGLMSISAGAAPTSVPVDDTSDWQILSFRKIPANDVTADKNGLTIEVASSASPLVYPLPAPARVQRVRVTGEWRGALSLPEGAVQGAKGVDDFVLKLGLVESGDQTLSWFQKRVAPKWIRTLFDLAPPDGGISQIHFLSTTQQPDLVGTSRTHPLSDLLQESRHLLLDAPGEFVMDVELDAAADVVALWISSDGDDTGSRFTLQIKSIELISGDFP
ncbi:MAG: hypothetical protein AAF610_06105 [Pseudomonadota bacterium]